MFRNNILSLTELLLNVENFMASGLNIYNTFKRYKNIVFKFSYFNIICILCPCRWYQSKYSMTSLYWIKPQNEYMKFFYSMYKYNCIMYILSYTTTIKLFSNYFLVHSRTYMLTSSLKKNDKIIYFTLHGKTFCSICLKLDSFFSEF